MGYLSIRVYPCDLGGDTLYTSMHFSRVNIAGVEYVDGPEVVTSGDLEAGFLETLQRLGHRPGFLESLTGVKERRFLERGSNPSDYATKAADQLLRRLGVSANSIDLIINTSVSKDFIEPSIASVVHNNLGLSPACMNFDVSNACLAFLNAMTIAGNMIERGQIESALIVDGEDSRLPVETTVQSLANPMSNEQLFRDSLATLTIGSGAAAMLLVRGDSDDELPSMIGSVTLSATHHNHLCQGSPEKMKTDSGALLRAGIDLFGKTVDLAEQELGWTSEEIDELVMHQVGSAHSKSILKRMNVPPEKTHLIFEKFGNIGPAAIPITLAKSNELGRLKQDDRIALMGIGSGLNCTLMELKW